MYLLALSLRANLPTSITRSRGRELRTLLNLCSDHTFVCMTEYVLALSLRVNLPTPVKLEVDQELHDTPEFMAVRIALTT